MMGSYLALLTEMYGKERRADATERVQGSKFQVPSSKFQATDPRSLSPDPQVEEEACFLKAIAIARQQQAKSWELRTSTSLARLWRQQGKKLKLTSCCLRSTTGSPKD